MARILYSTNSLLAYRVNVRYYGDVHYVWASPYPGNAGSSRPLADANPETSTPLHRYQSLRREVASGDRHGPYIQMQQRGVQKGAVEKHTKGEITESQRDEIIAIVAASYPADYRPLLFVIPFTDEVKALAEEVPVAERAHPLAEEYLIRRLPGHCFDILTLDED